MSREAWTKYLTDEVPLSINVNGKPLEQHLGDEAERKKQNQLKGALVRQGRKRHDQLENSVRQLLLYPPFRGELYLYKADATAVPQKNGKFKCRATPGIPDLPGIVCCTGRAFFVEIKTGSGQTRKGQDFRIAELRKAGAAVFVVHSLDEAEAAFRELIREEQAKAYLLNGFAHVHPITDNNAKEGEA